MKTNVITFFTLLITAFGSSVFAASAIYKAGADKPVSAIYDSLKENLEAARLFVVFEPNIGKNISGFASKWGENYNRNKFDEIRSLVFCNAWFANEVSNLDPDMLALCPLKITLTEQNGKTTALFVLPSAIAGESPAAETLKKIEEQVKSALKAAGFNESPLRR